MKTSILAFIVQVFTAPTSASQQILLTGNQDLRLISIAEGRREWMSENQIFALYQSEIKFIDVTDGDYDSFEGLAAKQGLEAVFPTKMKYQDTVQAYIKEINQTRMKTFLIDFSSFQTRYFKSGFGKQSAQWLFEHLNSLKPANNHTMLNVTKFAHPWAQFSIIARFESASESKLPVVIISAHQDSLNRWNPWLGRSPGADDDGSGTTTIIEALRILLDSGFIPNRPIEFHFYSAEEGGLLGSQKVVSHYMKNNIEVYCVFHNDMTGYQPGDHKPIIGISTDNVNKNLTKTLEIISDTYSGIRHQFTKCGYACSDHASWDKAGVPAVFVFETLFENSR